MSDTFKRLSEIVREQLGKDVSVLPTDKLRSLEMDSLDQVELVMAVEDEFGIVISDEEAESLKINVTFQELVTWIEDKMVKEGVGSPADLLVKQMIATVNNLKQSNKQLDLFDALDHLHETLGRKKAS